nr:amidohydrolase [uncultured Flavobacterium sp.]
MQVSVIQAPLFWENPEANREYFTAKIQEISWETHLVILPEMFTTGFTMNPKEVAETMEGATVHWMKTTAIKRNFAIMGSAVIREGDNYYNRLLFVFPTGEVEYYDKRHLFSLAGEHQVYTKGAERKIIDYYGWRICMFICYDLRFPVFARFKADYDLLVYVANWPQPRINAWDTLLKARAIENMSYVIGVNRVGEDANQHKYTGHSQVVDYLGNYLAAPTEEETIFTVQLDKELMLESRSKFGFLGDRDEFTLTE